MKIPLKCLSTLIAAVFTLSITSNSFAEIKSKPLENDEIRQEGMKMIEAFSVELKDQLKSAIKEGGLKNGIQACSLKAPEIALNHSQNNWQVKRTSLKLRNPANAPSEEELAVLEAFENAKAGGKEMKDLSYYRVTDKGSERVHHLMQAIPTQAMCLACHGESLSQEVQEALAQRYPDDQATGFKEGDIRGAFSLIYTETLKHTDHP